MLTGLEVDLPHFQTTTLEKLPNLLPHLSSLTARYKPSSRPEKRQAWEANNSKAVCKALKSCPGILGLDIGSLPITEDIWMALPVGLASLSCWTPADITRDVWPARAGLRKLGLKCSLELSELVALLAAAPNLSVLQLTSPHIVTASLSCTHAAELQYLENRLFSGLALADLPPEAGPAAAAAGRAPVGSCKLWLSFTVLQGEREVTDKTDEDYEHEMPVFMAAHMPTPLPSFTVVEFTNEGGDTMEEGVMGETADLSHLSRVFPNLQELSITNMDLVYETKVTPVQALLKCKALRTVKLESVDGFTGGDLQVLCAGSRALRSVDLCGCRGVSIKEEERVYKAGGTVAGVAVEIERGEILEMEDERRDYQRERFIDYDDSGSSNSDEDESDGDSEY